MSFPSRQITGLLAAVPEYRSVLEQWVRAPTTPQRVVTRSRIVLLAMDDVPAAEIAGRVGVSRPTVKLWAKRFVSGGPAALLQDAPGRGRHTALDTSTLLDRLREAGLLGPGGRPANLRRAALLLGVSASTVWRTFHRRVRAS